MKAKLVSNGLEFDITKAQFLFCVAKMLDRDESVQPRASECNGVPKKQRKHGFRGKHSIFTTKDDMLIIGMRKSGRPIKKIAREVHKTVSQVWNRISYMRKTGRLK